MIRKTINSNKAMTLAELMVAAYILLVGICGIFLLFINCMSSTQSAWDSTVAVSHAQYILEEMQERNSLFDIVATDWNVWAQQKNLNTLPDEKVEIFYANPTSNPLNIQVNINWQRKNTTNNVSLATILTR